MHRPGIVAALLVCAGSLHAQTGASWVPTLTAGTRVRATILDSPRPPLIGAFGGVSADSVRVILIGTTTLALHTGTLAHLDVSEGRERGRWAILGGLIGALGGGLIGGMALAGEADASMGLAPVAGFFAGMVIGAPTGAIVGAITAPERWTRYSNPR